MLHRFRPRRRVAPPCQYIGSCAERGDAERVRWLPSLIHATCSVDPVDRWTAICPRCDRLSDRPRERDAPVCHACRGHSPRAPIGPCEYPGHGPHFPRPRLLGRGDPA